MSLSITGLLLIVPLGLLIIAGAQAADSILAPGAKVEKVATGCNFTEGPAWDGKGNLYFSDCPNNRIMVYREGGQGEVWKMGTRGANGMLFDAQGRLVTCNSQLAPDGRTVSRFEADGKVTVLASSYNGKKLNSPNDLAIDSKGRIYFTDPRYGATTDLEQDRMGVYRIDTDSKITRVIDDVQVPNGILITPDDSTLYLADNSPAEGGNRTIIAYDIQSDGKVQRRNVIYDFGKERGGDGMVLDTAGNLYVTSGEREKTGVYVISPAGKLIEFIQTPETATNCTFGGADLKTLYITGGQSLFRVRTKTQGWLLYPKAR